MIQVNTGNEPQKSGIKPTEVDDFVKLCSSNYGLNICGLMCIPPANENPALHFALMHELNKRNNLRYLSMGMSNDYKTAIEFGATHIRIDQNCLVIDLKRKRYDNYKLWPERIFLFLNISLLQLEL